MSKLILCVVTSRRAKHTNGFPAQAIRSNNTMVLDSFTKIMFLLLFLIHIPDCKIYKSINKVSPYIVRLHKYFVFFI